MKEEIIDIKGMHCNSCVEKIETCLSQLKGVDKVRISLVEEKAYVRFNPNQTSLDTIKKEVEKIGYKTGVDGGQKSSVKQGILYGLIPHTGCIAFIVASILGATAATQFLKLLLLNPYFFYILILISFIFATISAFIYLKKQGLITFNNNKESLEIHFSSGLLKRKWKYLSTLYGTTIGVNLLLFMIIFPLLTNISTSLPTGALVKVEPNEGSYGLSSIRLKVDIPCPGHAPLISQELKSVNGVVSVQFSFPNIFDIKYDSTKTSKQEILSLEVFKTYKATVLDSVQQDTQSINNQPASQPTVGSCCGGGGSCGGAASGGCGCGGGRLFAKQS